MMKIYRKLILAILSVMLAFSLCSCGLADIAGALENSEATGDEQKEAPESAAEAATEEAPASALSKDRLKSIASIKKISDFDNLNLYSMEICYDYDFDNLVSPAGVYDDADIVKRLLNEALPGIEVNISMPDFGCSAFTLEAADGNVYMGRNYDFKYDTSAMQVYCHPKDGYASVSYCALDNLGVDDPFESEMSSAACLAAPFACLDGMNEKGVAIAVLTLPSTPTKQDSGKPVLSTSATIRLVLDKAATTQEAVDLIAGYDMYATSGRDYHFYITDATGDGRIVEWDPEQEDRPMVVTPIRSITNYFGMYEDRVVAGQKNGRFGQGKERKERIESAIARAGENTDRQTVWAALKSASTAPNPESIISNTQWSIEYNLTELKHEFALHRRWADTYSFENLNVPAGTESELPKDRIDTLGTIKKLSDYEDYNVYSMDVLYDYDIKNLTPQGPTDTEELMKLVMAEAIPGLEIDLDIPDFGCSTFSIPTEDGEVLMGRNYDFKYDSSCMMVHTKPWDGYESIAHAALNNIGADDPESSEQAKVACLAAPFICLDGINEKGVGIAVLTEDSEPVAQDSDKPVLATTILIRLVLDKAATTQEALALLEDYDMYATSGRDYHFFITDKSNDSCVVEWDPDSATRDMVATPERSATNFYAMYMDRVEPNKKNGQYGHGLERYQAMESIFDDNNGTGSNEIAWEAIKAASLEPDPENITSNTQWSIVYNLKNLTYELVLRRNWADVFTSDVLAK